MALEQSKNNANSKADTSITHIMSLQDTFSKWLGSGQRSKYSATACVSCLESVSYYLVSKNLSKKSIWEITDAKHFSTLFTILQANKIFRFTDEKNARLFSDIGPVYLRFLKENVQVKPEDAEHTSNVDDQHGLLVANSADRNHQPQVTDEMRIVDFNHTELYTDCTPVTCVINGEDIPVAGTWRDLLLTLVERFIAANNNYFIGLLNIPLFPGSQRPFLLEKKPNGTSKQISTGHWIYMNLSIANLVDLIGKLCRFCDVNLQEVKITYIPKGNNSILCNKKSEKRETTLIIPQSVHDVLLSDYANGFRFDTTAIRLLSSKSGYEVDDALQAQLKQQMFSRGDDIHFLLDAIADEDTRKRIVSTADELLDEFELFEISELYTLFEDKLNRKHISNADDFEKFYEFINTRNVRCVAAPLVGNRIARFSNGSVWNTFKKIAARIVAITYNEYGGTVSEDELHTRFFAFSTDLLAKIIKNAAEELVRTEINGVFVYQTLDALGLSDDFSGTLHNTLDHLDNLGIAPSVEALHTALSLTMNINFCEEFNIPDKATYQRLISAYYKADPPREWKGGIFGEVSN